MTLYYYIILKYHEKGINVLFAGRGRIVIVHAWLISLHAANPISHADTLLYLQTLKMEGLKIYFILSKSRSNPMSLWFFSFSLDGNLSFEAKMESCDLSLNHSQSSFVCAIKRSVILAIFRLIAEYARTKSGRWANHDFWSKIVSWLSI